MPASYEDCVAIAAAKKSASIHARYTTRLVLVLKAICALERSRRHSGEAAKRSRQMTLIAEAAVDGDVAQCLAGGDSFLRLLYARLANGVADSLAEVTAECAREMRRMHVRCARERTERELRVEVRGDRSEGRRVGKEC